MSIRCEKNAIVTHQIYQFRRSLASRRLFDRTAKQKTKVKAKAPVLTTAEAIVFLKSDTLVLILANTVCDTNDTQSCCSAAKSYILLFRAYCQCTEQSSHSK